MTASRGSSRPAAPTALARLGGVIRLAHPFPTLLNGSITAAVCLVAGGGGAVALRLGLAMIALQASIGSVNDVVDAARDAGHKPGKPIPAGLVGPSAARFVAVAGLLLGIGLSAPSGAATVAVAIAGASCGYAYDLRLKGTALSWAPFAIGVPLLPVYAWLGATGGLPASFAVLVPVAGIAGAGLAIANGLADLERDREAGVASVAVRLGPEAAWRIHAILQATVAGIATVALGPLGGRGPAVILAWVAALGLLVAVMAARGGSPARRERAWEAEALAIGSLAAAWVAALTVG
jgi:4-hydroxybenzoate polyprenyltransferase